MYIESLDDEDLEEGLCETCGGQCWKEYQENTKEKQNGKEN